MKTVIFFALASLAIAYPSSSPASDPSYNAASDPVPAPVADSTYNVASAPVVAAPAYEAPVAAAPAYEAPAAAAPAYAAAPVSSYGMVAAQPTIIPVPVYQAPTYNEPLLANTWRGRDFGRFEDVLSDRRRDRYGGSISPYFFGSNYGYGYGNRISNPFYDGKDRRRGHKRHGGKKHNRKHNWSSSSTSEE
ncbi:unnamed protein product, partial [Auanema sp. JU1783]